MKLYESIKLNIQRFAVTSSQTLTETSYDIASNTSQVRYVVTITATGSSYNATQKTCTYYIDGVKYTSTSNIPQGTTKTIVDRTVTVTHNSDGTRSVSASFSFPTGISAGTLSGSKSLTLTTIPRQSSIGSITGNTLGQTIRVNINRNSSSFTHIVWFKFGTSSWIRVSSNAGSYVEFTPTVEQYAQYCTNANKSSAYISIRTMNGSTVIGSDVDSSAFTVNIPTQKPLINSVTITDSRSLNETYGDYVQKISSFVCGVGSTGIYGSTIANTYYKVNGVTYNTFPSSIDLNGDIPIEITVKDSRGNTSDAYTTSLTLLEYYSPTIQEYIVERDETDPTSIRVRATVDNCNIGGLSLNQPTTSIEYNLINETEQTLVATNNDYVFEIDTTLTNMSDTDTFVFTLYTYDAELINSYTNTVNVEPSFTLMNYNPEGNGVAFGKISTIENCVEIDDDFELRVNGKFSYKTIDVKTENTNLNDYTENGRYYFSSDYTPTNIPTGTNGWMEVIACNGKIRQLWFRQGTVNTNDWNFYQRSRMYDGTWSNWRRYIVDTELYYQKNETILINEWYCAGFMTNAKQNIYFTIPYSKINNGLTASIVGGTLTVRNSTGTYLLDSVTLPNSNVQLAYSRNYGITIKCVNTSGYSGTNNTPVSVQMDNLRIKFT